MEEQKLQPVPEVINGNIEVVETEVIKEEIMKEDDDEEFYERIEAPKFVDFTKPYTCRTDDRYWFCSRVGCDQKHEEEINPEEISKNFVLRVLAARSPNIKLRKALNKEYSSMKCPLSAPAKPSKSRIPRLAMVSSLTSHKNGDPQSKTGPTCSKVGPTTPVVNKSRQVAAKYMTTPRNKMCHPNPNSFRSVQNPKVTNLDVPKSRSVAKALVFKSPKKAICVKKSVELHIPLKKICEGMKRLEIVGQKKGIKKTEVEDSSRKQLKVCKSEKKSKNLTPNTKILTSKVVENESGKMKLVDTSNKMNDLENVEDKENVEDHLVERQINDDDCKENTLNPEDNNNRLNNQPLGDKILNKEIHKKNKVVGPAITKCKKPKPTNIKPFRLRTDERGILREANLEKKLHLTTAPEKDISLIKKTYRVPKNEDCGKESGQKPRLMTTLRTRSPQGVVSPKKIRKLPGQQLGVIKEKSCKLTSDDVKVIENKSRVVSATRSTSRGKKPLTVAKEPNFHTSHLPRDCLKKVA